jgi:hypothetical protein
MWGRRASRSEGVTKIFGEEEIQGEGRRDTG